jgi:hypothetical protein
VIAAGTFRSQGVLKPGEGEVRAMKAKIPVIAAMALVAMLGSALSAHAGVGFSFSFGFGRSYGHFGFYPGYRAVPVPFYYAYRPYIFPAYYRPYSAPFIRPYAYRPYVYRPYLAPRYPRANYYGYRPYRDRWDRRPGPAIDAGGYRPRVYRRY